MRRHTDIIGLCHRRHFLYRQNPAAVARVRLKKIRTSLLEEFPAGGQGIDPFPGRNRDRRAAVDLGQGVQIVWRNRLLKKHGAVRRKRPGHARCRFHVQPPMSLYQELHISSYRVPYSRHTVYALGKFAAFQRQIGRAKGIPFQRTDPLLHRGPGLCREFLRLPGPRKPAVCIQLDFLPYGTSQKGMDRRTIVFSRDIPHGHLHRADGAHQYRACPPVGVPVHVENVLLNSAGVLSQKITFQVFHRSQQSMLFVFKSPFSHTGDSLVRIKLDKNKICAVGICYKGLDLRDFQCFILLFPRRREHTSLARRT